MNYKVGLLLTMLAMMVISVIFYQIDDGTGFARVHQHREATPKKETRKDAAFSTHLPIISIDTRGKEIPGSRDDSEKGITYESLLTDVSIIDHDKKLNHPDDNPTKKAMAQVAYRGNSSRLFDKKSLKVKFVKEDGSDDDVEVCGMHKDDEWVFHGPFLDRTLMRNYLCYNVAGEIMEYAPNCRYFELMVNGEYQGLYLAVEPPTQGKHRINIEKSKDDRAETSYIVRWDRSTKGDHLLNNFTFYTELSGVSALDVRYPGKNRIDEKKMKYIEEDISRIEKTLYSYDLNYSKKASYKNSIDMNSFAEYFIINEFFQNVDAGRFSTFYYKDVKGKVKLSVWDFNNACDNYIDYIYGGAGFTMQDSPWFGMLLKDPEFVELVVQKYRNLRKGVLSDDYLMRYIDETQKYLGSAVDRNYEKWGYVFDLKNADDHNFLNPVSRNYDSYEKSVGQLKGWIKSRGSWLDKHIDSLYQYCQDSKTKNTLLK